MLFLKSARQRKEEEDYIKQSDQGSIHGGGDIWQTWKK